MNRTTTRDAADRREVQEFTEALAAIAANLDRATEADREGDYMNEYDERWTPTFVACRRRLGSELAQRCVKDAYTLARA